MKKETIIAILATAVGVFVILLIIGLSIEDEKMVSVPLENTPNISTEYKDLFLRGCMESGESSYSLCSCAYNSLYNQLGENGIYDLSIKYIKTEELPEKVVNKMISDCL